MGQALGELADGEVGAEVDLEDASGGGVGSGVVARKASGAAQGPVGRSW
jgi:hypothetical protein